MSMVTFENVCRAHMKLQVIIKMNKFNMFITGVCVLFLINQGPGIKGTVDKTQFGCSFCSWEQRASSFMASLNGRASELIIGPFYSHR